MYIDLINYYLMFTRSIRIGDFQLFKFMIPKLCNIFFIFNQVNYSRWLLKYHDNLLKVDETHPELATEFKKGFFGIKRTDKPFSRIPVDLTLEQTINADAANKLTGIVNFTNSISARQRWAKSHSLRSTIISHVHEESGLKKVQDVTSDLEKHQLSKDSSQLEKFIEEIEKNINPFDHDKLDNDLLYNISTGQSASKEVATFLLNLEENGNQLRETFIEECSTSNKRFEEPIKKNKILNFASCNAVKKLKINNKVQEVRLQRDLFGRMLGISLNENTNVEKVLTFPLTPLPMC